MELIFGTHNENKVKEVKALLPDNLHISSLTEIGITAEIPETGETIPQNAMSKAYYVWLKTGKDCFAEDSGLEVDVLNGAPGVRSARYAGEQKNDRENLDLLLKNMNGQTNRKARFRTVMVLIWNGTKWQFDGEIEGTIIDSARGTGGFGYDPVFIPDGYTKTFAEMSQDEKSKISHRGIALKKILDFIDEQKQILSFQEDDYLVQERKVVKQIDKYLE